MPAQLLCTCYTYLTSPILDEPCTQLRPSPTTADLGASRPKLHCPLDPLTGDNQSTPLRRPPKKQLVPTIQTGIVFRPHREGGEVLDKRKVEVGVSRVPRVRREDAVVSAQISRWEAVEVELEFGDEAWPGGVSEGIAVSGIAAELSVGGY